MYEGFECEGFVLSHPVKLGGTSMVLKVECTPDGFRDKAKQLKSTHRRLALWRSANRLAPHRVPKRQAPFSKAVAQTFLDDGEIENYENYKALYK
jgi:hypothetical protein